MCVQNDEFCQVLKVQNFRGKGLKREECTSVKIQGYSLLSKVCR